MSHAVPLTLTPAASSADGHPTAVRHPRRLGCPRLPLRHPADHRQAARTDRAELRPRRFADNWALGQVKADLDARTAGAAVPLLAWDFYELRRAWNQAKDQAAPWWRCSSKEVYAAGITDLVTALGPARTPRRAAAPAGQWGSFASRPAAATVAGSASPLARCVLSPTGATSSCR